MLARLIVKKPKVKKPKNSYTIDEARELSKNYQNRIYDLQKIVKEMITTMRAGTFVNEENKKNFHERLSRNNKLLSFFEQELIDLRKDFGV